MLSVRSSPSSSVFENPNPNLRKRYLDGSHKGFERSLIDAYGRDPRVRVSEFELQSERNRNLGSRYPQQPSWNQPSKPPSQSSQNLHNAKGMCNNFQTPFVATSLPPPVHPSLSQSVMPVPSVGSRPPVNQGPSISRVGFQFVVPATPVGLRPPVNAENSHTRPERSSFTLPNQRNSSTVKNQGPLHSLQNSGSVVSSNQTGISPYSGLLSSLLAQGVISLPNKTPHQDSLGVESKADPHQHGPLGVEFKPELLSVRNESVLSALYKNGPTPSSTGTLSVQNSGPSLPKNQPDISAYSGLLSSLVAQGVISLPKQESLGVVFKPELLKVRHESVIHSLYSDMPRQCTTCGHRFKCQEEHRKHMDWHVVKNRMSKTQTKKKQTRSRMWFVDTSLWLGASSADAAGPKFKTEAIVEKKKIDEETAVPADEDRTSCALCGEAFDDFYSQLTEDWMYKDAAYLNAPDLRSPEGRDRSELGPIVHKACISDGSLRKRLRRSKHSGFR